MHWVTMSYKVLSMVLVTICVFGFSVYVRFSYLRLYFQDSNFVYEGWNRQTRNISQSPFVWLEDGRHTKHVVHRFRMNVTDLELQSRLLGHIPSTKKNSETNGSQRFLIYSCSGQRPCGGWGDRLRGMLSTFIMAELTNRKLVINMTSPCHLTKWLLPHKVNWLPDVTLKSNNVIFVNIQNNRRFANMLEIMDLRKLFKNYDVKIRPNFDLFSRLKNNPRYEKTLRKSYRPTAIKQATLFGDLYEKLFELSPELNRRVYSFLSMTRFLSHQPLLICAQIRIGRNPSIPRDTEIRTNLSDLPILWKFLEKYKDEKRYKLFVTTDSKQVRQEARVLFPNVIVDTAGPVSHPDFAEMGGENCKGFGKVILDQYLLKYCDTLVITKSLFGVVGAYLRGKNDSFYQFINGEIVKKTLNSFQLFS